jgi:hypothetical protein
VNLSSEQVLKPMPTPEEIQAGLDAFNSMIWPDDRSFSPEYVELLDALDLGGITQAILSAAEAVRQPLEATAHVQSEALARAAERQKIADHISRQANEVIRNPKSDGIDGYVAAQMLGLANSMTRMGK